MSDRGNPEDRFFDEAAHYYMYIDTIIVNSLMTMKDHRICSIMFEPFAKKDYCWGFLTRYDL